jgi:epoxyqueuosine reductase
MKAKENRDALARWIKETAAALGFDACAISRGDPPGAASGLADWLAAGFHGEMDYMARHGPKRASPAALVPGTQSVISVRLDYWPTEAAPAQAVLDDPHAGYISRYALGRDYHKVLRRRLQQLADAITQRVGPFGHRVFTDSAPVMEVALAREAGVGWRGKHTLLLARDGGSLFFLGELFTDLDLPADQRVRAHCGSCTRCIDVCPTQAIVAPYRLDARRCISYLTIEHAGSIPEAFRAPIGNRIYGCDDCQLVCPWNRYARRAVTDAFAVRQGLDDPPLIELFAWSEQDFMSRLQGSAIRRIGHRRWLRNLAVALGNALRAAQRAADRGRMAAIREALGGRAQHPSALVREHVYWALAQDERATFAEPASGSCGSTAARRSAWPRL